MKTLAIPATAGSIIGMPGVSLAIEAGAPYASRFELANKGHQLSKGIQLMFSVRWHFGTSVDFLVALRPGPALPFFARPVILSVE
jgi:hypothetical protein